MILDHFWQIQSKFFWKSRTVCQLELELITLKNMYGLGLYIRKLFSREPSSIDPLTRDNIKLLEATSTLAKKADAPLCRMSPPVSNDKDDDVSIPDQLISK